MRHPTRDELRLQFQARMWREYARAWGIVLPVIGMLYLLGYLT